MNDFDEFFNNGEISYNMLKYIPGLAKSGYQGQLSGTETTKKNMEMNLTKTKN